MKIAVSMIALNERDFIGDMIPSCDFADYLVVVDGGSTDGTMGIVKDKLPDGVELVEAVHPWDDHFGKQRQRSLVMIPEDVDWWIRGDADEIFSHAIRRNIRDVIATLPEDVFSVAIRQTNFFPDRNHYVANIGGFETWPRMFKHLYISTTGESAMKWVDPIHEHVMWLGEKGLHDIPPGNTARWSAQVYHQGWLKDERRAEREMLYAAITGKEQNLTDRGYVIKRVPESELGPITE